MIAFNDITAAMASRPALTTKIAECIAEFAEVEFALGSALGALLKSEAKTALAMFVRASSRNAQMTMLRSAAEAALPSHHFRVFEAVINKSVSPAMADRDRLAHWCWGYSPDLPKALLIMDPARKTVNLATHFLMPDEPMKIDRNAIYVVTEADLARTLKRIREARRLLNIFIGTVWQGNSDAKRDQFLQSLSAEPLIRTALSGTPSKPHVSKSGRKSLPQSHRRDRHAKP